MCYGILIVNERAAWPDDVVVLQNYMAKTRLTVKF